MKRLALVALSLLLLAAPVRADIITLDDGTKIEGEIVKETETEIELKIPLGATKIPKERVVKIEKKASPTQEFEARRAKLDAKDAAGRIELAKWALDRRFPRDKGAELAVEAWRIDPGNEGAIEILVTRLDYHFEKDAWVAPDKWYPAHGYVRKDTVFITLEAETHLEAVALVKKLQAAVKSAEQGVKTAEAAIADAPNKEAKAKKALAKAEEEQKNIGLQKDSAKTVLDARDTDLKIAADKTVAAQTDLTRAQRTPCPADAAGKVEWDSNIRGLKQIYLNAVAEEASAKKARDLALAEVERLGKKEQLAVSEVTKEKGKLDSVHAETKKLEKALPSRRADLDAAVARLAEGEATEASAKAAAEKRRALDVKDAADRLAALRAMKKR